MHYYNEHRPHGALNRDTLMATLTRLSGGQRIGNAQLALRQANLTGSADSAGERSAERPSAGRIPCRRCCRTRPRVHAVAVALGCRVRSQGRFAGSVSVDAQCLNGCCDGRRPPLVAAWAQPLDVDAILDKQYRSAADSTRFVSDAEPVPGRRRSVRRRRHRGGGLGSVGAHSRRR